MNDDVRELCAAVRMAAHALPGMLTKNPLPTLDTTRSLKSSLIIYFYERLRLANFRPGADNVGRVACSAGVLEFLGIIEFLDHCGLCD